MLKPTDILDKRQKKFLELFSDSNLNNHFYLTGGTALCGFYIPYRYSEDLDFFSQDEFPLDAITVYIRSIKEFLDFNSYDIQTVFNRNLVFLEFSDSTLKTEFTYFPFPAKDNSNSYQSVALDSLEDIALNKLFTIYQKPRLRDFMDLFKILQETALSFNQLIADSKVKFDWHIDPVQLGSQLLKVKDKKDVPRLAGDFSYSTMEEYFQELAAQLGEKIVTET